tara:strand:- start:115 stop:249 length:135 start_codon:yes stop_codon:yes gene_type:complete
MKSFSITANIHLSYIKLVKKHQARQGIQLNARLKKLMKKIILKQ